MLNNWSLRKSITFVPFVTNLWNRSQLISEKLLWKSRWFSCIVVTHIIKNASINGLGKIQNVRYAEEISENIWITWNLILDTSEGFWIKLLLYNWKKKSTNSLNILMLKVRNWSKMKNKFSYWWMKPKRSMNKEWKLKFKYQD